MVKTAGFSPLLSLAETCFINRIVRFCSNRQGPQSCWYTTLLAPLQASGWSLLLDIAAQLSCLTLNHFFPSCGQTSDFIMSGQGHPLSYTVLTHPPFPDQTDTYTCSCVCTFAPCCCANHSLHLKVFTSFTRGTVISQQSVVHYGQACWFLPPQRWDYKCKPLCWLSMWVLRVKSGPCPFKANTSLSELSLGPEHDTLQTYVLSPTSKVHIYCCSSVLALLFFSCEL